MATEKYHLGERVAQVIENRGMSKAEFARRIYTSRQNVNTLLRREDISVWQLAHIGKVLGFNFFAEIAGKYPSKAAKVSGPPGEASPEKPSEFIALFHRPRHIRMTKAIQCLEESFGPEACAKENRRQGLVFQGVYQLIGESENGHG